MSVILINGVDYSDYLISYTREKEICTGIGTLNVQLSPNAPLNFVVWDIVTIYENNIKVGKFYINTIEKQITTNTIRLSCTDGSKKLSAYFLDSFLTPAGVVSRARNLIISILNEAKVDYIFNVSGDGALVPPETELGLQTAYDAILTLLQQSGWYFYFDEDNTCIIGKLKNSTKPAFTFTDNIITDITTNYNDSSYRNKVVVWGGIDPITNSQILFSKKLNTAIDRSKNDLRTVVLSNGAIYSTTIAKYLGNLILSETSKLTKIKTITIAGFFNIKLGQIVKIKSNYLNVTGLVTRVSSTLSSSGFITEITLDQRCPRIFGWFSFEPTIDNYEYVYASTIGYGVKRKPIGYSTWYDFSAGLENLNVLDLRIYAGNFICVAGDGYAYTRDEDTSWTKYYHGILIDSQGIPYPEALTKAVACAIDQSNGDYYIAYNYYGSGTPHEFRSWTVKISSTRGEKEVYPVSTKFTNEFLIYDMDRCVQNTLISAISDVSNFQMYGFRDVYNTTFPEKTLPFIFGPQLLGTPKATVSGIYQECPIVTYSGIVESGVFKYTGQYYSTAVYSGAYLTANINDIIKFHHGDNFLATDTIFEDGKITFFNKNEGLVEYDFSPAGYTTINGSKKVLAPYNNEPIYGHDRFIWKDYSDGLVQYPDIHLIFIDTYGYNQMVDNEGGNHIYHKKYVYDSSLMTYSGVVIKNGAFIESAPFKTLINNENCLVNSTDDVVVPYPATYGIGCSVGGGFRFYNSGYYDKARSKNGVIFIPIFSESDGTYEIYPGKYENRNSPAAKMFLYNYYIKTGASTTFYEGLLGTCSYNLAPGVTHFTGIYALSDVVMNFSNYYKYVNCLLGTICIREGDDLPLIACLNTENNSWIIHTRPRYPSASVFNPRYDLNNNIFYPFIIVPNFSYIDGEVGIHPCDGIGMWVTFIGTKERPAPSYIKTLSYKMDESGSALIEVNYTHEYQTFTYRPTICNPWFQNCGVLENPEGPAWHGHVLNVNGRVNLSINGYGDVLPIQGTDILSRRAEHIAPLIVPAGYPFTWIEAKNVHSHVPGIWVGDYYIIQAREDGSISEIPIPLFSGWSIGLLNSVAPYIDFFDDTIYFSPGNSLYGIDYYTGVLKKNITGFTNNFRRDDRGLLIHNGIIFKDYTDFYVLDTTITGYNVFPIMYQNKDNYNIINIETSPALVEMSKAFPAVSYTPPNYTLPTISGKYLSPSTGTKIYSFDFSSYITVGKAGNCERVFDAFDDPLITTSGIFPVDGFRYLAIPENNVLYATEVTAPSGFINLKEVSGIIKKIETSNLPNKPYIFISSTSGFYEYDKEDDIWRTFSNPCDIITEIRVDDLL